MGSFARRFVRLCSERRGAGVWLVALSLVIAGAIVLSASSSGGGGDGPHADAAKSAAATVDAFDRAVLAHDFATVCDHLFTPEARVAAGGAGCAAALSASGQGFTRLRVTALSLHGDYATATVVADQAGSPPVTETLALTRRGGRFLISSSLGPAEN